MTMQLNTKPKELSAYLRLHSKKRQCSTKTDHITMGVCWVLKRFWHLTLSSGHKIRLHTSIWDLWKMNSLDPLRSITHHIMDTWHTAKTTCDMLWVRSERYERWITHLWSISTKALPEWYTHLIYNPFNVCEHLEIIIEVAFILFYTLTYFRWGVFELEFGRSGVEKGLVREVSVPRHFLNDTITFYMSNEKSSNTS